MDKLLINNIKVSFGNLFKSKEHQECAVLEAQEYYSNNLDKLEKLTIKQQNHESFNEENKAVEINGQTPDGSKNLY